MKINKNLKDRAEKILSKEHLRIVKKLNTPSKIQDFIENMPFNFERSRETYWPPIKVLRWNKAHCFEGATFACFCLEYHGIENYLVDLNVGNWNLRLDSDHTLAVFKINGYWGAISKTNHSVLRFRDPIYKTIRELTLSYFHEYFLDDGSKTLKSFSQPFDIWGKFGIDWALGKEDLDEIATAMNESPHENFVPEENAKFIRRAGETEIKGSNIEQWQKYKKVLKYKDKGKNNI